MIGIVLGLVLSAGAGIDEYQRGEYAAAVEKFAAALTEKPDDARLDFDLASALYKAGRYAEAEKAFARATRDAKLAGAARYGEGNARFQQKNFDGAVQSYEQALRVMADDADAKANLELARRKVAEQQQQQQQQQQDDQKKDESAKQNEDGTQEKNGGEQGKQDAPKDGTNKPGEQQPNDDKQGREAGDDAKERDGAEQPNRDDPAHGSADEGATKANEGREATQPSNASDAKNARAKRDKAHTDPQVMSDEDAARTLDKVDEKRPRPRQRRQRSRSGKDW